MSGNQFALEDHYKTLGVSKSASDKEIKEAFYKLAKKYHPDSNKDNKNALQKFQEISNAYECLTSKDKKEDSQENRDPEKHHGTRTSQPNVRVRKDFTGNEFAQEDINIDNNSHFETQFGFSEQHPKRSRIRQNRRQQNYNEVFRDLHNLYESLGKFSESFQYDTRTKKPMFGLPIGYIMLISLFLIGLWVLDGVEKQNYEIRKNLDTNNDEKNNESKYQKTSYMSSYDKYEANRKQKIYMRELNQKIAEIEERRSK